jgi:peptidoglycan/LPS O-acetylase OafA/YrhL
MRREKLDVLQVGRGLAALAVVLNHVLLSTRDFVKLPPDFVSAPLSQGFLGVDFFFVLSGFIILQVHRRDPRTAAAAGAYARKRVLRIYSPYLPIGVAMAAAYALAPGLAGAARGWSLLTSLTLIPSNGAPALSVAWTLELEITFYAIFLLFYATRYFAWLVGAWVAVIVAVAALHFPIVTFPKGGPASVLLAPISLEFVFGMLACLAWRHVTPRWGLVLAVIGAAWLAIYLVLQAGAAERVLFGLGVAVLVCGLVALEGAGRLRAWAPLVILGDASYAIYLVHDPVISVVMRLARAIAVQWWVALPICAAASLIAGFAYHFWFEDPVRRYLARRIGAGRVVEAGQS